MFLQKNIAAMQKKANLSHNAIIIHSQVEYALKCPIYAILERLEQKRNIEQFKTKEQLKIEGFKMLKSGYW
jgi:hypothetical protein